MKLVIIEGVGKQDTIKKYLGSDYEVFATKGHVRDLPEKELGVNVIDNFKPKYEIMPDKKDVVRRLKEKSARAQNIYLATDPDREGEAISWHLSKILDMDADAPVRITFNEITKHAVNEAIANPRAIDQKLVDAQQARRVLDRLVGYKISPIICRKIQQNLSAGRVQSVTLKLVVDRENEIVNFKPEEYYNIFANLYTDSKDNLFKAKLSKIKGKDAGKLFGDARIKDGVVEYLKKNDFVVKDITKKLAKSHPSAPYTTSSMQQDGIKNGMTSKEVSSLAQQLYEGVELKGEGKTALVTYIRTDSVRIAPEAIAMARNYIEKTYGEKYLPSKPNYYKTKDSAQDAHEAIRPINLDMTPAKFKELLGENGSKSKLARLYELIYNKFLACQMSDAEYDSVNVTIENGKCELKASGRTEVFDGFTKLYHDAVKSKKKKVAEEDEDETDLNAKLPKLEKGQQLNLEDIEAKQKFTKPASRYTEGTRIKEMEDKGSGRPATYAPTIQTLLSRKYIEPKEKALVPTELGYKVCEFMERYFTSIMNVKFTADMETKLDDIANKGTSWQDTIASFYKDFEAQLKVADRDNASFKAPAKETDIVCSKCGHKMVIRTGKFGEFLACSNYPKCKNIEQLEVDGGICPKCGKKIIQKHSKKGSVFYGCTGYPECDFVSWDPICEEHCPNCGSYMTMKETDVKIIKKCSNPKCKYRQSINKEIEEDNEG